MKRKTIEARRQRTKNINYGEKVRLRNRGILLPNSPFKLVKEKE